MVETIGRGILIRNDQILLSRKHGAGYYALIGGHIGDETLREGVKREYMEETNLEVAVGELLYLIENRYTRRRREHHEVVFYFRVNIIDGEFKDKRKDATVRWIPLKKVQEKRVLPPLLKKFLVEDLKTEFRRRIHLLDSSSNPSKVTQKL